MRYNPNTSEILEIYDQPTDALVTQHDVDYSVYKDDRKCKNNADRKMVKALDAVPYDERRRGHFSARNMITQNRTLVLMFQKWKKPLSEN